MPKKYDCMSRAHREAVWEWLCDNALVGHWYTAKHLERSFSATFPDYAASNYRNVVPVLIRYGVESGQMERDGRSFRFKEPDPETLIEE